MCNLSFLNSVYCGSASSYGKHPFLESSMTFLQSSMTMTTVSWDITIISTITSIIMSWHPLKNVLSGRSWRLAVYVCKNGGVHGPTQSTRGWVDYAALMTPWLTWPPPQNCQAGFRSSLSFGAQRFEIWYQIWDIIACPQHMYINQ